MKVWVPQGLTKLRLFPFLLRLIYSALTCRLFCLSSSLSTGHCNFQFLLIPTPHSYVIWLFITFASLRFPFCRVSVHWRGVVYVCWGGWQSLFFKKTSIIEVWKKKSPLIPVAGKQTIVNITRTVEDFFKVVLINISHDALFCLHFFAAKNIFI